MNYLSAVYDVMYENKDKDEDTVRTACTEGFVQTSFNTVFNSGKECEYVSVHRIWMENDR